MAVAHTRVFISHSTKNAAFADRLVERLRDHYITTWYAPRHMPSGYFAENIRQALNQCDWIVVVHSPEALAGFRRPRRGSGPCGSPRLAAYCGGTARLSVVISARLT